MESRWNVSVADDVLNPYAPPVAAEPLASPEAGRLWMVHGDHLLVRDGARLPPVPLFGKEDGGELTTSQQVFATSSGASVLALAVPVAFAVATMVIVSSFLPYAAALAAVVAFFVSARLLRRSKKMSRLVASIQCHIPVAALKARARRDRVRSWMIVVAWVGFLIEIFSDRFEGAFAQGDPDREYLWIVWFKIPLLLGVVVLFFGSSLWALMDPWLKCVSQTGGWFYLRGVPGPSLAKLASMSADPPPLRTRKVYPLFQYRLPMGILLGPRRNPLLILVVAIMKLLRSPAFVRQNFHWSETRRGVQPGEDLAERIAELRSKPEFASWRDMGCSRLDSPTGDLRILTARLMSPDRRHLGCLTLYRISKARVFVEVFQSDFHTWTADGRCLLTSSQATLPRLPDYIDFQRVKGDAARVWSRHLQRCEQVTPMVIESDEELGRLLEKESEDHAELLRAGGIQGPVEELEMPGDWEDVAMAS